MRILWTLAATAVLTAAAGCERDDNRTRQGQPAGATPDGRGATTDRAKDDLANATGRLLAMVRKVSEGEVEMGKLAQARATSPAVKEYATRLVDDHQQDIKAIDTLSQSKNIKLDQASADPFVRAKDAEQREAAQQLSGLSGADFEKQFLLKQPAGHAMLSKLAVEGERLSNDPEVDGFFKTVDGQANEHKAKALMVMPKECGGQGAAAASGAPGEQGAGQQGAEQQGTKTHGAGKRATPETNRPPPP